MRWNLPPRADHSPSEAGAWPEQIAASGYQRECQGRGGGGWVSGVGAEPDFGKHHVSPTGSRTGQDTVDHRQRARNTKVAERHFDCCKSLHDLLCTEHQSA